ncbi:MAG: CPBP family intramembrane metalloprotease [Candidatus Marinimicrobia bacterium]|nr:CPBP family intramembrane metalloprotease [Candidatus Neomarinimicrobiota bacterium]
MIFLKTHFQNYQKLSQFRFLLLITFESVLLSFIIGSIIEFFWDVPIRSFVNLSTIRLFVLLVILAPLIETLMFQTIPISIVKYFRANFTFQIFISFVLFAIAHFLIGWQVGISAGTVAGFYLAFTYAHWIRKSHLTAFWITALSHSIRNSIGFIFILIFLPQYNAELIQYDLFVNKNLGRVWHFYDYNEKFLFAIVDEDLIVSLKFNKTPNSLFNSEFSLDYPDSDIPFRYENKKKKIWINEKEFSIISSNVFFLNRTSENLDIEPVHVPFEFKEDKNDIFQVPIQIEKELFKRK